MSIFYYFGDRSQEIISKNQFFYFIDCYFRAVCKIFVISEEMTNSDSLSDSNFSSNLNSINNETLNDEENKLTEKGKFFRLVPNGILYKNIYNNRNFFF